MTNTSKAVIKEIRSGLFSIKWDYSQEMKKCDVYAEQFTLDVFKSTLNLAMHLSFSGNKRYDYINTFYIKEFIDDEESSDCSDVSDEISSNEDQLGDSFDEDAYEDDESDVVNDSDLNEEEEEDDQEDDQEPEEQKQQMDEPQQHPLKVQKTQSYPPMYMWIYTTRTGTEKKLTKDDSDAWKVRWRSSMLPEFITLWIDFGTCSSIERNAVQTMNGLASMFYDQLGCDVQFNFKDGKSVGAHSLILSVGSPVFSVMFQSGLLESQTRQVNITDIELEVFRQLLIHLYTGRAPKLADKDITQLLFEAADKYAIDNLKDNCVEALKERVTIDNVVNLLVWSHFHSIQPLFEIALKFTVENYRMLFFQSDFEDFLKTFPDLCLQVIKSIASLSSP